MCAKISKNAYLTTWINNPLTAGPFAGATPYYGFKKQRDKEYIASMLLGSEGALGVYSAGEEGERRRHESERVAAETQAKIDEAAKEAEEPAKASYRYNRTRDAQRALAKARGGIGTIGLLGGGRVGMKTLLGE